jgi:hypothetical protein
MMSIDEQREKRVGKALTGDRTQCGECGELFASVYLFDRHRIGEFGTASRRCMSVDEMKVAGMTLNSRGFWH